VTTTVLYGIGGSIKVETMRYGDYVARIMLDETRGGLHGRVQNLTDVVSFEAATVEELRKEFEESVKLYLDVCEKRGVQPTR